MTSVGYTQPLLERSLMCAALQEGGEPACSLGTVLGHEEAGHIRGATRGREVQCSAGSRAVLEEELHNAQVVMSLALIEY